MLNKEKHQLLMGQILRDIYTDVNISSILGFKGGTCVYFFYNLTRFSVDLDFDLLVFDEEKKELIFKKIVEILSNYGEVKNYYIKRFTIFALLSYGPDDHNIKIEINTRKIVDNINNYYELNDYLGISVLTAKKEYLFASKLVALTSRKKLAMRDVYDIYYFAKNNWDIDVDIIKKWTDKKVVDYLRDCVDFIEKIGDNKILQGLGELVDSEKEKAWIKSNLKKDCIFVLKNYITVYSK
ncbi:MAG: nucleotidyl transferase AbiEii/AbiGii toxin family protein [Patescibacteria group bacterium]|nr:nucleotidyl transferase AbiEii/AbiGii toxin family protein [Patescibacteria group bacterium]